MKMLSSKWKIEVDGSRVKLTTDMGKTVYRTPKEVHKLAKVLRGCGGKYFAKKYDKAADDAERNAARKKPSRRPLI